MLETINLEIAGRNYPLAWNTEVWEGFARETENKHPMVLFSDIRKAMHLAAYKGELGTGSDLVDLMVVCSIICNSFDPQDASRLLYFAAHSADDSVTFDEIQEAVHIEGIAPEITEKDGVKIYTYPMIIKRYMDFCLGIKPVGEIDQKKTF